ncbi:DODA-type extradiol aromatic ring-opening family dioxygenase [Thalassococcus lentus]|uniref:Class III extradiol ring-cleavage dioxygenase n=1 Tax=Thalassococcus lentus TaxID=1210524 RepID=A0ABT4XUA5_9RHOB|nr:class III extradiol ring-cleavage dioxygenase [Thalassococcus lentus]MDA7425545.1 class III extradiol ring-cleavage dioxygenase [Thalassococcus lentus]
MNSSMPTYFISHGGGPWPYLPKMRAVFANLETSLRKMVEDLPEKPKAVLMISGHWEADDLQIMASEKPPMVYDYHGFPPETYEVVYPAPGAPGLAQKALTLLTAQGITAHLNTDQGFDHGTFTPMEIMYPDADVPVFQISLLRSYDPADHFAIGRALAPLRDEGVMIVGSGLSFHNLRMFGPAAKAPSEAFDAWLGQALEKPAEQRTAALLDWESAPYARVCHKQEDHLVPLFVALGAAESGKATRIYHDVGLMGGVTASSYRFD